MKTFLVVLLLSLSFGKIAGQTFTDLKGNWKGLWTIDTTDSTRLYLRIAKSGTVYSGLLDALDFGDNNIPSTSISNNPPFLRVNFTNVGYYFEGNINSNFTQLTGIWTDGTNSWPLTFDRNPSIDEMEARTYSDGFGTLPYRLFVPTISPAQSAPLVVFLHGSGERGSDNRIQITAHTAALAFTFNENQAKQRCILAAPQCPSGGSWVDTARRAQIPGLIATLKALFNIDTNRVYVTGLSMGGIGTWDLLSRNTNLFAAGIPMSGSTSASASTFFQIPVWDFHASNDGTVNVSGSRNAIAAMRALGGTPVYTEYAGGGHVIWTSAYATPLLFDWVMAQKRGAVSNVPPFVTINSPSDQTVYATAGSAISLAGIAGDATTKITQIAWTNNRGGSGSATGTNNWSVPVINLQTGTNILTAQATGTAWVLGYGGTTTFSDVIRVSRVAPPVVSVVRTNGFIRVAWSGGVAPFALDSSTNLDSGVWDTSAMGTNSSAILTADQPQLYFRVRSQ
jgi:predicted esterase